MGIFGDKPENQASQESISPQMVESLKIRHWEIQYNEGTSELKSVGTFKYTHYPDREWVLSIVVTVTLKGNLTSGGAEVGFFLNYNLLGAASCDEWGKVSFCKRFHHKEQLIPKNGDKLTVRIKGMAIEDEVVLTLDGNRNGKMV
jgi:hypothetical protein